MSRISYGIFCSFFWIATAFLVKKGADGLVVYPIVSHEKNYHYETHMLSMFNPKVGCK